MQHIHTVLIETHWQIDKLNTIWRLLFILLRSLCKCYVRPLQRPHFRRFKLWTWTSPKPQHWRTPKHGTRTWTGSEGCHLFSPAAKTSSHRPSVIHRQTFQPSICPSALFPPSIPLSIPLTLWPQFSLSGHAVGVRPRLEHPCCFTMLLLLEQKWAIQGPMASVWLVEAFSSFELKFKGEGKRGESNKQESAA